MNTATWRIFPGAAACLFAMAGLSGCATTSSIDSQAELAELGPASGQVVVFGKFRLIRNGEQAVLGEGILGNSATMRMEPAGGSDDILAEVGRNGEFAWALEPGLYRISSIGFSNRGARVEPITNFTFDVAADSEAVYIGTVTMDTTFDSGFYGLNGIIDSYTVSDDCAVTCDSRLSRLGLADAEATVSLMHQEQSRIASTN